MSRKSLVGDAHPTAMIAAIFRKILLFLTFILLCQLTLTSCNPTDFKTAAAQSQWVTSTIGDIKTFNQAFSQEFPHVFLFTAEGLTTLNAITKEIEPALAQSWEI